MNERIKEVRKALNLSQDEFASRLGLTRGAITNIELYKTEPKPLLVGLICSTYSVNETWLRTGEGEMFVQPTRDEEIAAFVGAALSGEDENFKRRLLSVLIRLDEKEWQLLEKMAKKLAGE